MEEVGGSVVVAVPVVEDEKESMTPLAMSRTVSARRTMASRVGSSVGGGRGLAEEGSWKDVEGEMRRPSRPRASSGEGPLSGGRKSRRGLWHDGHCVSVSFSYTYLHPKQVNAFMYGKGEKCYAGNAVAVGALWQTLNCLEHLISDHRIGCGPLGQCRARAGGRAAADAH